MIISIVLLGSFFAFFVFDGAFALAGLDFEELFLSIELFEFFSFTRRGFFFFVFSSADTALPSAPNSAVVLS